MLLKHYISYYNEKYETNFKGVHDEVIMFLNKYSWPGNVRELQHVIESAMLIASEPYITLDDLPAYIYNEIKDDLPSHNSHTSLPSFNNYIPYDANSSLSEIMCSIEKDIILKKLAKNRLNVSKTAVELGIPRQTLQYKLQKYNIVF